jgi:hypothetical protein
MTGACGINCDVCGLKAACGGCLPGTDPKAPERAEEIRKMMGAPCPVLECAIKNKVDYCLSCDKFPCEVHYHAGLPYSKTLLDIFKEFKKKK